MKASSKVIWRAAACAVAAGVLASCGGSDDAPAPAEPQPSGPLVLKTLSNRADMISDGDALVELVLPTSGVAAGDVTYDLNGTDISSSFAVRTNGRVMGVVTGLRAGENLLTARLRGKTTGARLAITNFTRGGNIFAGVPIQPWVCATRVAGAATVSQPGTNLSGTATTRASGLDADPVDADCNAPTKYTYYYQPKAKEGTACTFTITGANPCRCGDRGLHQRPG